jgi:hypothetical protein
MESISDHDLMSWLLLTSVKHSPGVEMRNPSSPLGIGEHGVVIEKSAHERTLLVYGRTVASGPR